MDDAEACFILSSRNEVDRTAAVSRIIRNFAGSQKEECFQTSTMKNRSTGGRFLFISSHCSSFLNYQRYVKMCLLLWKRNCFFLLCFFYRITRQFWGPGLQKTLLQTVLCMSRSSNQKTNSMLNLQASTYMKAPSTTPLKAPKWNGLCVCFH